MTLSGLEILLLTTGASTVSALFSSVITAAVKNSKGKHCYTNIRDFSSHIKFCQERFRQDEVKMEDTANEVGKLNKRFERFIIFSDMEQDKKAKILNGE
jgi:hypothetical protein